jgi:hypothetical protein
MHVAANPKWTSQGQGSKMAEIQSPTDYRTEVTNVGDYLTAVSEWHQMHKITEEKFLSGVWFRGNGRLYPVPLRPGVYRDDFTDTAKKLTYG